MDVSTIDQVRAYLQGEYDRVSSDWYRHDPSFVPAKLTVELRDAAGGFSRKENRMVLYLGGHNLEDFSRLFEGKRYGMSKLGWFPNQSELYHEMLHEYQYKALREPSDEGRALYAKYGRRFSDPGHDEFWSSAIAEKASYFGVTSEELHAEM